jgi:hypothetical protein
MNYLIAELVKKPCTIRMKIEFPVQTLERLMDLFSARSIQLDTLQMHGIGSGEALLTIYCPIEGDRIKHTRRAMEKLDGILEIELLESKGMQQVKA